MPLRIEQGDDFFDAPDMAATTVAADLLDQRGHLGRIAPGFAADLVAIEGSPLENIQDVIGGVRWVMKDGVAVVNRVGMRNGG